ncbi:MAG: U32 family peptidase [Oscillospiraceae bacterium]|nr:U32 family peptidase [Oscillospiraceae bacterium]
MKHIELLAPAGDFECLQAAANFGADAVYIGGDLLQLRAGKVGFSRDDIRRAAAYLHARGKKLYVTVNCFAQNDEITACADYARFLQSAGVDAAIISDMGVMAEFAAAAPALELHVSTQANCMNYRTAAVWATLGAKRIVLARELSLADIRALREQLDPSIELEAFVHGAMCMAYSGRCLISSYLASRSGNRGECAQPCRWSYTLLEEKRPGEYFPIEEDEGGTAILSSHDLCCIELLPQIADAGVCSFKIEGRMKSAYYVAAVVNAYRKVMDGVLTPAEGRAELECLQHRPYATGFYEGAVKSAHYNDGQYTSTHRFMANVLAWQNGEATLRQRNNFKVGDELELLSPHSAPRSFTVGYIRNEAGELQDAAPHPNQTVFVPCPFPLQEGDMLRRREV